VTRSHNPFPHDMMSGSQISPAKYLLALCNAAEESHKSLGTAIRLGASNSQFQVTKVIHSIVTFSPATDAVAVDFLKQLGGIEDISHLGKQSPSIPARFF